MIFQPSVNDKIRINNRTYRVAEHPSSPGLEIPFGQEGRQGCVYQLLSEEQEGEVLAIKVFKQNFRAPFIVYQSDRIRSYSEIEGLRVCDRTVIIPEKDYELLAQHSDLLYAAVMPWIQGPTWYDILTGETGLSRKQSLDIVRSTVKVLSAMEQRGLAHCDLSAPNILIPGLVESNQSSSPFAVELVDVEQMYGPGLEKPDVLTGGSPGYASHRAINDSLWNKYADRFAGGILLSEMLAWSIDEARAASWGDSYFDPNEIQMDTERYHIMYRLLKENWGVPIAELFSRTWKSEDPVHCPTFGDWFIAIMSASEAVIAGAPSSEKNQTGEISSGKLVGSEPTVSHTEQHLRLLAQARELEKQGQYSAALDILQSIKVQLLWDDSLYLEINIHIDELSDKLAVAAGMAPTDADQAEEGLPLAEEKKKSFWRNKWFIGFVGAAAVLIVAFGTQALLKSPPSNSASLEEASSTPSHVEQSNSVPTETQEEEQSEVELVEAIPSPSPSPSPELNTEKPVTVDKLPTQTATDGLAADKEATATTEQAPSKTSEQTKKPSTVKEQEPAAPEAKKVDVSNLINQFWEAALIGDLKGAQSLYNAVKKQSPQNSQLSEMAAELNRMK